MPPDLATRLVAVATCLMVSADPNQRLNRQDVRATPVDPGWWGKRRGPATLAPRRAEWLAG